MMYWFVWFCYQAVASIPPDAMEQASPQPKLNHVLGLWSRSLMVTLVDSDNRKLKSLVGVLRGSVT